jgi:hypothetical protein
MRKGTVRGGQEQSLGKGSGLRTVCMKDLLRSGAANSGLWPCGIIGSGSTGNRWVLPRDLIAAGNVRVGQELPFRLGPPMSALCQKRTLTGAPVKRRDRLPKLFIPEGSTVRRVLLICMGTKSSKRLPPGRQLSLCRKRRCLRPSNK